MRAAIQIGNGTLTPHEVRFRLGRAAASGHHHWLWPEIQVADWQGALGQIESTIRAILSGCVAPQALVGHPAAMGIAAYTSGMGPLLGYWIEQGFSLASHEIAEELARQLAHNRARMIAMERRAKRVVEAFAAAGLRPVMLKGIDSAYRYFPEAGVRPISDIDVLCERNAGKAYGQVLHSLGFETREGHLPRQTWYQTGSRREPMTLAFVHRDDPWSIDLHLSLDRSYAPGTQPIRLDLEVLADCFSAWDRDPRGGVLGQPVALLNLMVHAASPLLHLSLLRLVEMVLVIRKDLANEALNWDELLVTADRAQALGIIYVAVRLVERLAPGTVPSHVVAAGEQAAPARVRRLMHRMTPAEAQCVRRFSISERFMWSSSAGAIWRQVRAELWPSGAPTSRQWHTAKLRVAQLLRAALARN